MKKVIRKNQVIITSLAILIAIAGYLNFADVDLGFGEKEASTESSSILDQVDYDLSDESAVADENQCHRNGRSAGRRQYTGGSGTDRSIGFCSAGEAFEGTGAFTEQSRSAGDSEQHRSRG